MIRLVALDVDGTLVDRSLRISSRVRNAIDRMQRAGVRGFLVTGRMYRATLPFVRELALDAPVVCYQGAVVIDPTSDELLRRLALENEVVREVIAASEAAHAHLQLYRNEEFYCEARNRFSELYASLAAHQPIVVPSLRETFAYSDATKAVIVADAPDAQAYETYFRTLLGERAYVTRSLPEFVEILNPRVDKGEALRFVADYLGVPIGEVMAIGDSWNDAPLLKAAGFSVAMGSAPQELRALAGAVVADVANDGVAEAIDRYVLDPVRAER